MNWSINSSSLGRIVAAYKWSAAIYFIKATGCMLHYSLRVQAVRQTLFHMDSRSVAGLGVRGPFGPRTGSSSGIFPGNSCGCGG
jgi:hypothetical protein